MLVASDRRFSSLTETLNGLARKLNRSARSYISLNRKREVKVLTDMMALTQDHKLLDVGCGDGFWSAAFADQAREVVGIDPSPELLAAARSHYRKPNLRFDAGTVDSLPYADGTFDRVVAVSVVEHFPNPAHGLVEMSRVLRPGGVLAISVDSLGSDNSSAEFRAWHTRKHYVKEYFDEASLTKKLNAAGLKPELSGMVTLFSSRTAGKLRAIFIRNPYVLLPLFPLFLAACRLCDLLGVGGRVPPQILIVRATKG